VLRASLRNLSRWLSEPVMGFLALAALCVAIVPILFQLPPRIERALDIAGWAIVGVFAAEYLVHLALARHKLAFALDPWRIVDALIILAPLASLAPFAPDYVRSSPALRVLRLARVLLFGARVRHGLVSPEARAAGKDVTGPPRVAALGPQDRAPRESDWNELLRWIESPDERWMHAENLGEEGIRELAGRLGLSHLMVEAALRETSYPRLESSAQWCAFSLSFPTPLSAGDGAERSPVLLLAGKTHLLSLSLKPLEIQRHPGFDGLPWGARGVLRAIQEVLERNEALAGQAEQELRRLEGLDAAVSPQSFFEAVFRLKRSLALAKGDLWRLHTLLAALAEGRRELPGLGSNRNALHQLSEQADYLHETVEKAQEALLTVLDIHLNMASYDVNRFMRLLAVVSSLALIPTIIGGLLGMNILGNPWPVTLSQVAFGTFILMLCVLYAFMAKGWLR
jgi:Mg2+ and Co2+ transporter CorA